MLTPQFSIIQSESSLTISLTCPYIKAQEVQISVNGTEFSFHAQPYFLRLTLPKELIEDGRETSKYDISSGIVTLCIPKLVYGEHFQDLDLLTKLMDIRIKHKTASQPMIQVLSSTSNETDEIRKTVNELQTLDEVDDIDWHFAQNLDSEDLSSSNYGFNNLYQGYGKSIDEVAYGLIDVSQIDSSTTQSRRNDRLGKEELLFNPDAYICDVNNEDLEPILDFKPDSWKALKRIQIATGTEKMDNYLIFTQAEQDLMVNLPNKEYLIDNVQERRLYLGLIDLLFAYSYNYRTTLGEDTVESAWTVCRLSGTLSALDTFDNLRDVLSCSLRRILTYPLFRSYKLVEKIKDDVVVLVKLGKRGLLKVLLKMRDLIGKQEQMFMLERIYIEDYCIWIQQIGESRLISLASELNHTPMHRNLSGWPLEQLDLQAQALNE